MDTTKILEVTSADELKVLDDAELDTVTGGLLNRSFVGLVNLGVGVGSVNLGGASAGNTNFGIGQSTGNFSFS